MKPVPLIQTVALAALVSLFGETVIGNIPGQNLPDPDTGMLRAGAAAVDITPMQFPVNMMGSFSKNMADGVHDALHSRALVLDNGIITLAIVVVDNIGTSRGVETEIREIIANRCGISPDKILIASTHTHSAPASGIRKGEKEAVAYREILVNGTAEAVVRAHAALRPAAVGHAVGELPEEVFNRRWFLKPGKMPLNPFGETDQVRTNPPNSPDVLLRPAGPTDPEITVLSIQDTASNQPLALLANYGLHYVGHLPKRQISADYFGEFARLLPVKLGAGKEFVAMLSNGASGDVVNTPRGAAPPRPARKPFEQVQVVAQKVADIAAQSYRSIDQHRNDVSIGMIQRMVSLRRRRPTPAELSYAKTVLGTVTEEERAKLPPLAEIYARRIIRAGKASETRAQVFKL